MLATQRQIISHPLQNNRRCRTTMAGCPHTPAGRMRTAARASKMYWGRNLLSGGVFAVVEGPGLAADEFQQLNTSPKPEQDPSTPASTPPLRRFRPRQIILARAAVLILRAGVRPSALRLRLEEGQPAPESAFSLSETKPTDELIGPLLPAKPSMLSIRLRLCRAM